MFVVRSGAASKFSAKIQSLVEHLPPPPPPPPPPGGPGGPLFIQGEKP